MLVKSAQEQVCVNYTGGSHDETGFTRTSERKKKQCLILIQSVVAVRQIQYWNFANLK